MVKMKDDAFGPVFVQLLTMFTCFSTVDTAKRTTHQENIKESDLISVHIQSPEKQHEVNNTAGKLSDPAYFINPSVHNNFQDENNIPNFKQESTSNNLANRHQIAIKNLAIYSKTHQRPGAHIQEGIGNTGDLLPGDRVQPFSISTLDGFLFYPGPVINYSTPVLVHAYNPYSGFARCLWNCTGSLEELFLRSPNNTHYIFISHSSNAVLDAIWMKARAKETAQRLLAHKR